MGRTESPNLKNDYERACGWYGHFNKSEMALFSECTDSYAQKLLDTADIVREAILRQLTRRLCPVGCGDHCASHVTQVTDMTRSSVQISCYPWNKSRFSEEQFPPVETHIPEANDQNPWESVPRSSSLSIGGFL